MSQLLRPPSHSPTAPPHPHPPHPPLTSSSPSSLSHHSSPSPVSSTNATSGSPSPAPPPPPAATPPPPSATPPPQTNTCTHYHSISIPTLHSRFRVPSFLSTFPSAATLPCADCRRLFPKKDLWVCLSCPTSLDLRCGRGADSACAIEHAKDTKHGLVMNTLNRMIWCYFCDTEVLDEYGQRSSSSGVLPQKIRHCIDPSDPQVDPEEEQHTKPARQRRKSTTPDDALSESGDEEEEALTWFDYYNNPKGGEVGFSNLGNTCFANSALQALTHTPPLIAFLSEMSHIPLDSIRQRLIADFSVLLHKVWSGHYSLVAPGDLLRDIIFINPFFRGYGQHDAQELIRCLIDQMHEGLKRCESYEYTRYVYGEGTGEEQEVRWRERELLKEKEKLMDKVRERRGGKKGDKDRKRRERDHANIANGHSRHSSASSPASSSPPTPTEHKDSSSSTVTSSSSSSASFISTTSTTSTSSTSSSSLPSSSCSSSASQPPSSGDGPIKRPIKIWPEHSIISDIFSGYLQSRIRCHQCNSISTVYDQFYDLSLEIPKESNMKRIAQERGSEAMTPPGKQSWLGSLLTYTGIMPAPLSLETCLHSFCTSDRLIDRDQYRCDVCKVKVDASKTLALHSLPEVLMLHIKRFAHNAYFGSKVSRHVNFPVHGLDMKAFLSEDKRERFTKQAELNPLNADETLYDLYAVIRHLGSVAGGHYIAYAKNHLTGKWYEFDDRVVTEVSEKRLSEVEAYVLFYRKRHNPQLKQAMLDRIHDATLTSSSPPPTRFLSRQFVKRVSVLGRVEPIDNRDLLCSHGVPYELPSDGGQLAIPMSKAGWERLIKAYGGGPLVDGGRYECAECAIPVIRQREKKRISMLDNEASIHSQPSDPFYLIHDDWLRQWRAFISGSPHRPGPITNHELLQADGRPKEGLQKVRDYRGLHGTVWDELLRCYGGGPEIVRRKLDIYDESRDEPVMRVEVQGVDGAEGGEEEEKQREGQQGQEGDEEKSGRAGEAECEDDEEEMIEVSFHTGEGREEEEEEGDGVDEDSRMREDKVEEENKSSSPVSTHLTRSDPSITSPVS